MFKLIKCFIVFLVLIITFFDLGALCTKIFKLKFTSLPLQLLVGFFAYFGILEIFLTPIALLHLTVSLGAVVVAVITACALVIPVFICKKDLFFTVKQIKLDALLIICIWAYIIVTVAAILTNYQGWDISFYVGEVNSFLYYNSFWTHDVEKGGIESALSLRYTLSCFYPFWACLCKIMSIEARLMAMYVQKALCTLLSCMSFYTLGDELFHHEKKKAKLFLIMALFLCAFCTEYHAISTFLFQRSYEAKAFCIAVVCPTVLWALIRTIKYSGDRECIRYACIFAWPSMAISMSSMAVVPVGIAIGTLINMITNRKIKGVLLPGIISVLPNCLLMLCYVVGK